MKFGHTFQEHLEHGGFPSHWVASAISYRQLKKCIKRVEKELAELGLNAETLSHLLRSAEESQSGVDGREKLVEYTLAENYESDGKEIGVPFQPKLMIAVDEESGEPLDATLSPKTRDFLHQLALGQHLTRLAITGSDEGELIDRHDSASNTERHASHDTASANAGEPGAFRTYRMVEVPLRSDSEFFGMLQGQISALGALQAQEQAKLSAEIKDLGKAVARVTEPNRTSSKSDMAAWRSIFEMYLESKIFFSTNELDRGRHDSAEAQALLQKFAEDVSRMTASTKFRKKESRLALEQFLQLNMDLLSSMRFQDINSLAMQKILKKFDKRSGFGVQTTFPAVAQVLGPTHDIAKAICYEVSTELLPVVPQLHDYLCPVCFSISFRPIRLRCQHIFCIRCLVVLQRAKKDHCPLCRGAVVMEADSQNLDPVLADFLVKYFPEEVRAKQRDNEKAAGVDRYGEAYNDRCRVM
ncbi:hypothetical protein K490DRAFT_66871 [Saccharata proteae CBS 121410]|uniref:RING-14 protein-like protein n=1 Tax=Saccharata proteae CBS 121410 TaxID=1314787 RepID=A0A9P4HQZ7_9PEZI|nr:hypothetical protein K490DRAFT_66871 [Saccharata proteae CBS 121410]